ncbi:hypothetical protein ACFLSE_02040 [Bacteroidota bacterium]
MKINFNFWIKWLKITSIIVIVFGIFMAFSSIMPNKGFAAFDKNINPSFFSETETITESMKNFQSWQYGVGASILVSWAILMFFLSKYPLAKKEKWAWNALVWGLTGWFLIDETISLYYMVYFNAIFNIVFLIMFLIPLIIIRKHLKVNSVGNTIK